MTNNQYMALNQKLGNYLQRVLEHENSYFGVISNQDKQFQHWFDCFSMMVSELFDDAKAIQLSLPIEKDKGLEIIEKYRSALEEIEVPKLVHKDIWEGNIFVDEETYEFVGIID